LTDVESGIKIVHVRINCVHGEVKMYDRRYSIRNRAVRVARQKGWLPGSTGSDGGGFGVAPVLLAIVAVIGIVWLAFAITGAVFGLIPTIVVGLLAGWAASRLTGARLGTGWTVLAGILGSWVGGALLGWLLPVSVSGFFNPLQWVASILGAAIVITAARVMARPALIGASRPRFGRL
jgi:uncharacterized membrane protein YeaQ/YmgE (transglycosylase-associated protein family)